MVKSDKANKINKAKNREKVFSFSNHCLNNHCVRLAHLIFLSFLSLLSPLSLLPNPENLPNPEKGKRPPSLAGVLQKVYERTRTGARVAKNLYSRSHHHATLCNLFPHRLHKLFQTDRTIGMTGFLRALNRLMLPDILDLHSMTYATLNRHGWTSLSYYSIVEYYRQMAKKV